jgi:acyl-CoA hydrolase
MTKNNFLSAMTKGVSSLSVCLMLLWFTGCNDDKKSPNQGSGTEESSTEASDSSEGSDSTPASSKADETSSSNDTDSSSTSESSKKSSSDMVVLCFGDSITLGVGTTDPYPSKLARLTGATVINAGVRSQTSSAGLRRLSSEISRAKPTHVCILFGTNDVRVDGDLASAAGNISSMVGIVNSAGAKALVGTIPPLLERGGSLKSGVDDLNGRIRRISGARIVDIAADFGSGAGTINGDGIHPNNNGAAIIAVNFSEGL